MVHLSAENEGRGAFLKKSAQKTFGLLTEFAKPPPSRYAFIPRDSTV
jgi:hypothetical protein